MADLCLQGSIHLPTVEHCKQRSSTTGILHRRTRRRTRGRTCKREWSPALHDHVKDAFGFVNGQCPYLQTCLGKKVPKIKWKGNQSLCTINGAASLVDKMEYKMEHKIEYSGWHVPAVAGQSWGMFERHRHRDSSLASITVVLARSRLYWYILLTNELVLFLEIIFYFLRIPVIGILCVSPNWVDLPQFAVF